MIAPPYAETLRRVVRDCAESSIDVRSYSGRGMSGAECLGIDAESPLHVLGHLLTAAVDDTTHDDDFAETVRALAAAAFGARTDAMGRGCVVYWPGVAPLHDPEETLP